MFHKIPKLAWVITTVVIVIDQFTKQWVAAVFYLYERVSVMPMLDFTLTLNRGAAFSVLATAGGWQRWLLSGISVTATVILLTCLSRTHKKDLWMITAFSLILGGAIGNLIDRAAFSYVIDFILVYWQHHYFPAFNIADSAITVGAGMLMIDLFRKKPVEIQTP